MDGERVVTARFVRRRLIVMIVATFAAAPIIILGGDFNVRETVVALIAAAFFVPIVAGSADFIARRIMLGDVFAAIATGKGDLDAMVPQLTSLPWRIFPVWTASFVINVVGPITIGNVAAGLPLGQNVAIGFAAAVLGSIVYFSILGLSLEEWIWALVRVAAERQGRRSPTPRIAYSGLGNRIGLAMIAIVLLLVGSFAIDGTHLLAQLRDGRLAVADAVRVGTIELAAIGAIALMYGLVAARFLSETLWPVRKVARALRKVGDGNLDAFAELDQVPRLPHEAGVVVGALSDAEAALRAAASTALRLADGDLTTRVAVRGEGDFLGHALAVLFESVSGVLADARGAAGALGAGSSRVDANAERLRGLAAGIADELQAASASVERLEHAVVDTGSASNEVAGAVSDVRRAVEGLDETVRGAAAALVQLTRTVEHGGIVVAAMSDLARGTSDVAADAARALAGTHAAGERAVAALATTRAGIEALDEASQRIGAITETMDEIAGQTNLLALNAAIEAARAGEHGRGFAVVADEIRALATRASSANAEIASLVRDVQRRTGDAVAATREGETATHAARDGAAVGAQALEAILRDAAETAQRLKDVASSYGEQVAATTALEHATSAVQAESQRGRAVAERLSGLADRLAGASREGADAVGQTRRRSLTLVGQGRDVAREAAELAALTPPLREAAARLSGAVARFRDGALGDDAPLPLAAPR